MKRIFLLFAASALLFACNKEEGLIKSINTAGDENIIVFNSYDEYNDAVSASLERTLEEKIAWEKSQGFRSVGSLSDEFYRTIDIENFESLDAIKEFAVNNSEFVTLTQDENGEYSLDQTYEKRSERYLINKKGMHQVNNMVFKVLEENKIYADISNVDYLDAIENIEDVNQYDENMVKVAEPNMQLTHLKDTKYNCGNHSWDKQTNGNNRTCIDLQLINEVSCWWEDTDGDGYGDIIACSKGTIKLQFNVKPQKRTLGVWFNCERTLSFGIRAGVDFLDLNGNWVRSQEIKFTKSPTYSSSLNFTANAFDYITSIDRAYDAHFAAFYAWGTSFDTGNAVVVCNPELGK